MLSLYKYAVPCLAESWILKDVLEWHCHKVLLTYGQRCSAAATTLVSSNNIGRLEVRAPPSGGGAEHAVQARRLSVGAGAVQQPVKRLQ